jgi:hypothetical protein
VTENEAVEEARSWLPKLGLCDPSVQPDATPTVFPPQKTKSGRWWVWLHGRETLGGPLLTVLVSVSSGSENRIRMQAVIVERAAIPTLSLPRHAPRLPR